ncbi:hypothetical protein NN561_015353 [Cricetulus griseus]
MPELQHPLRPPWETTFNSPGGWRGSLAGAHRDNGCRGEGGAREPWLPECASSILGSEERTAFSSRSPRDCSPDVTCPPSRPTEKRQRQRVGCLERGRGRECECACVHASVCPAGLGTIETAAGSEIQAPGKAVLRGYCEQLGALASQLGLSLDETRRNRLR